MLSELSLQSAVVSKHQLSTTFAVKDYVCIFAACCLRIDQMSTLYGKC